MTERFEIFPQNVAKDGTLIIIQKGLKLYNISDVVDLLNGLTDENNELKETLAFRSNQLALMEQLIDDLGSEEMARQMEEILND